VDETSKYIILKGFFLVFIHIEGRIPATGGGIPAGQGEGFRLLKGKDSGNRGKDSGYYPLVINIL
jgi:hypothetical protein